MKRPIVSALKRTGLRRPDRNWRKEKPFCCNSSRRLSSELRPPMHVLKRHCRKPIRYCRMLRQQPKASITIVGAATGILIPITALAPDTPIQAINAIIWVCIARILIITSGIPLSMDTIISTGGIPLNIDTIISTDGIPLNMGTITSALQKEFIITATTAHTMSEAITP